MVRSFAVGAAIPGQIESNSVKFMTRICIFQKHHLIFFWSFIFVDSEVIKKYRWFLLFGDPTLKICQCCGYCDL
jgi:hypothetical protein